MKISLRACSCALLLLTLGACSGEGNYPEAGSCSRDNPWYAVCTHASHNLSPWSGPCRADREQAEQDAKQHADEKHGGDDRSTGTAHLDKAQLLIR